jgi:hypothetical protein
MLKALHFRLKKLIKIKLPLLLKCKPQCLKKKPFLEWMRTNCICGKMFSQVPAKKLIGKIQDQKN